jgi:3-isopropylmalate dehydrogenase
VWEPENVNSVIIRENNEGFYHNYNNNRNNNFKNSEKNPDQNPDPNRDLNPDETPSSSDNIDQVIDKRLITRTGTKQIIKFAFDFARHRNGAPLDRKKRVTCVDKSNVLDGCRLFRGVFKKIAKENPDIDADFAYIDSFTLKVLQKPEYYDVIVTTNLFGDIITDLAAMLQGGLGMAPSANLGLNHGMFEPVHGSAPDIAGKNIANPIGMILSTNMMLEWLGEKNKDKRLLQSAQNLKSAIQNYFITNKNLPYDIGGNANSLEVTQNIISNLKKFY